MDVLTETVATTDHDDREAAKAAINCWHRIDTTWRGLPGR